MKGSLQLKRGIWHAVIYYKDEIGSSKYKWYSTGLPERGNKKEAKEILNAKLIEFEKELDENRQKIIRRSKTKEINKSDAIMLFSDYIKKHIESKKSSWSPEVYHTYSVYFTVRIKDFFDKRNLRLIDITNEEIDCFNKYLKEAGLKNKSIKHYACVLRPALRQAYKEKIIPDNPYDFVAPIKKEKPNIKFYDQKEMAVLFNAIKNHKFELAFKVAAYYGLRRSELLGLKWSAIDFEHKIISINHKMIVVGQDIHFLDELKTNSSYRTLPLIPTIEAELKLHKERIEANKDFFKNSYDNRYLEYVFVRDNGKIIYPNHLSNQFLYVLRENKLKHIRLHDLRHSCASIMLANGVQMKQIQDWLGHSNFSTTADVYAHLDFSAKVHSAAAIANALTAQ